MEQKQNIKIETLKTEMFSVKNRDTEKEVEECKNWCKYEYIKPYKIP